MDIVYCFDDNYAMPTGVSMLSVCENNKEEDTIVFHLVSEGLNEQFKEQLKNIAANYGRNIHFHLLNIERLRNAPSNRPDDYLSVNVSTYYRLLLSSTLPDNMDKVLYMDSDTVVCDSLKELWNIDIDNYAVAAATDCTGDSISNYNRLDYDFSLGYFSAGVLLINLKYWRNNQSEDKLLNYMETNSRNILYYDQDVLNYVFKDQKKELSMKYNLMTHFLRQTQYVDIRKSRWDDMFAAAKSPVIIHYFSRSKPWHKDSVHLLNKIWLKYYKLSPWGNVPLKYKNPLIVRMLYKCKKILIHFKLIEETSNRYRADLDYRDYEI